MVLCPASSTAQSGFVASLQCHHLLLSRPHLWDSRCSESSRLFHRCCQYCGELEPPYRLLSESWPFCPHIGLSFFPLWTMPRRLLGVVSARESFYRDRRQAQFSLTSLTVSSSGAVRGQSYILVLRIQLYSSHNRVTLALDFRAAFAIHDHHRGLPWHSWPRASFCHPRWLTWAYRVPRRYFCVWTRPPVQHFKIARLRFAWVWQPLRRTRMTRCLVVGGHRSADSAWRMIDRSPERPGPDVAPASTRLTTSSVASRKHLSLQGPCVYKGLSCRHQLANSSRSPRRG